MAALRLCLPLSLACLRIATSAASDELSLIQGRVQPEASVADLSPLLELLPSGADGTPLGFLGNVSAEQATQVGIAFLGALRDKAFINKMYRGLQNYTALLGSLAKGMLQGAQNLSATTKHVSAERAFWLLEHYALQIDDAVAALRAGSLEIAQVLVAALPPDSRLEEDVVQPFLKLTANLTKEKYEKSADSALRQTTKELYGNRSSFCSSFRPIYENNYTSSDRLLANTLLPEIKRAAEALPSVEPTLSAVAPDVAPELMRFLNTSVSAMRGALATLSLSHHIAISAMHEVAEHRVNCSVLNPPAQALQAVAKAAAQPAAERAGAAPAGRSNRGQVAMAVAAAVAALLAATA
mmetsp:Transcript_22360/g.61963  ORF Transcript_22360/g.61963 Transcript_22360/m.61963 type:complete len:353 (-) Transcript_22360:99-1157(-)